MMVHGQTVAYDDGHTTDSVGARGLYLTGRHTSGNGGEGRT